MSYRRRLLFASLLVAMAGGTYGAVRSFSKQASLRPGAAVPAVPSVRVQEVGATTEASERSFTGVVRARYESELSFRVGGKVIARLVDVGSTVRAGQTLARLDPGDRVLSVKVADADLAAAEAALRQATIEYDRTVRLVATNALPASELDRMRSERDGADARRERARASARLSANHLAYCTLTADTNWVVTSLPIEAGQVVAEGQTVARVARIGQLEAVVSIPENGVASVRESEASVTFWSHQGPPLEAVLRELSPSADPITRTYTARFTIRGPGPEVALGMTATVRVTPKTATRGYALPLSALLLQGARPALWVVDRASGHLTLTPVNVLQYRQDTVVVSGGVKAGDLVATAGVQKLDAGMTVRAWEPSR